VRIASPEAELRDEILLLLEHDHGRNRRPRRPHFSRARPHRGCPGCQSMRRNWVRRATWESRSSRNESLRNSAGPRSSRHHGAQRQDHYYPHGVRLLPGKVSRWLAVNRHAAISLRIRPGPRPGRCLKSKFFSWKPLLNFRPRIAVILNIRPTSRSSQDFKQLGQRKGASLKTKGKMIRRPQRG